MKKRYDRLFLQNILTKFVVLPANGSDIFAKVFSCPLTEISSFKRRRDYDDSFCSCIGYAGPVPFWEGAPYNAECGVSVVYFCPGSAKPPLE